MKNLLAWIDNRTGIRDFVHEALYENIPGGARWRYVWGSTLVFTFVVQMVTGLFLWMCYSPSAQTAWESVYYIQFQMQGGWLLRGIHHFTAQAMVVLLVLHLMQVIIDGAYRAPREVNFWLGLVLMQIVLGLSLTGYLLPWDQKGYWATRVATNLMGLVPFVGDKLQQLVVGGTDYGHLTLTRFFALHAGLLPASLIFFLVLHVYMFRRHGITHKQPLKKPDRMFWPDQVLKDAVACMAVLIVVLLLVLKPGLAAIASGQSFDFRYAGAELGAPADPSRPYSAARPEWYFLFLFQLLKYFPGTAEIWGAIVLPGVLMGIMFLMPILGRWKLGHVFNMAFVSTLIVAAVTLTVVAWKSDRDSPDYLAAVKEAEEESHRAIELAQAPAGIPPLGAVTLLRSDPKIAGKILYERNCASCHPKMDQYLPAASNVALAQAAPVEGKAADTPADAKSDAKAEAAAPVESAPTNSAPTLRKFASREWLTNFLNPEKVNSPEFFGNTSHKDGTMVSYVKDELPPWHQASPKEFEDAIIALSAQARLPYQAEADAKDAQRITDGEAHLKSDDRCASCHKFGDAGAEDAPDLTGYGSRQWLLEFISDPAHKRFYGENNDRMPSFAKGPPGSPGNQLSQSNLELIVDYIRESWYEPAPAENALAEHAK